MSFITKLKVLLARPAQSKKERMLWFIGLYTAAVIGIFAVSGLLHLIVALLSIQ